MNKFSMITLCAAVALTSSLFAGSDKVEEMKKMLEDQGIQPNYVETAQKGVKLSGYVDVSYTYSPNQGYTDTSTTTALPAGAPNAIVTSPTGATNVAPMNNRDSNDFSVNAVKLTLEKDLSDANEFTAGFRTDLMVGEDAQVMSGNNTPAVGSGFSSQASSLFLEQAYVQFRAPIGNGIDFKVGKFVTLLGYEVIESPANINFTRGLLFTFAIPLTHVGALASYKFNDIVDMQMGIVNGWNNDDTYFGMGPGTQNNAGSFAKAVTGRINVTAPGGNANIANSFIISPNGGEVAGGFPANTTNNSSPSSNNTWTYDIWGNWAPKFANDKLLLGFNGVIGGDNQLNTTALPVNNQRGNIYYGAALYAKYQFTPKFSLGSRAEYFVDSTGMRTGWNRSAQTGVTSQSQLWEVTLTASFDLWENMLARLEYRHDGGNINPYGYQTSGQGSANNNTVALNFVYSF